MLNLIIPIFVGGLIQLLKVCIDFYTTKTISMASLWSAGGFPSTHSGIAASLSTVMFMNYGYDSPEFIIAIYFSFLFWYDAANIRFQAGQHASFINKIHEELEKVVIMGEKITYLKERLGHTFFEVLGGIIVGVALTITTLVLVQGLLR